MKTLPQVTTIAATATLLIAGAARADEPLGPEPRPGHDMHMPPYTADEAPPERDRTLLGGQVSHGGYGAPEAKITTMTGDAAMLLGGQGGWVINHGFVLGVAGYGLTTQHTPAPELQRLEGQSRLQLGYGGGRLAWIIRPHAPVHLTLGTLIGAGGVIVSTRDGTNEKWNEHDGGGFFALEPQAEVELNLHRHVRLAFGGSYRYLSGVDKPGMHASDLSGPAGALAIKFGVF